MINVFVEIAVIVLLVLANGLFSMSEIAILTSKKHLLRKQIAEGSSRAQLVLTLAEKPESFLSAVQVGITMIGIVTGVFSGATLSTYASAVLVDIGLSHGQADMLGVGAIIVMVSYLTLIFGELVPKQIAIALPNASALMIAPVISAIKVLFHPLVLLLTHNTSFFVRLFGLARTGVQAASDDDVLALIDEAKQAGNLEEDESRIMHRTMRLSDKSVSAIMTHRSRIFWVDAQDSDADNLRRIKQSKHTCFPYSNGTLSEIIGIICVKDILGLECTPSLLHSVAVQPLYVHESTKAFSLLSNFKETGARMAVVLDEYGSVEGIVTPKDLMEAIVGEIKDTDEDNPTIVAREDGSLLVDAHVPLDECFERLGLAPAKPEATGNAATVSGLVMHKLQRLPKEGDHFVYQGFRFEVVDLDGARLDKVLVSACPDTACDVPAPKVKPGEGQG